MPRQALQADFAAILANTHAGRWTDTDTETAAKLTRRVDVYVADLRAEIDSATRLIARLQMARTEVVA